MKNMSVYSGEDLLKVFKDLHVNLLNLSPNVIKAWFDTDDRNMKNLLNWMCSSLSSKNYVSPLENSEFLELDMPLVDHKYDRELRNLKLQYPGILDIESNELEIELMEDEMELLLEEERELDDLIRINEVLQSDLSKELSNETTEDINTMLKLRTAQEQCNSLGEQLDDINDRLHMQLVKYGSNLYDFEFGPVPNFISNMDVNVCQENFDNVSAFLMPLLETESLAVSITGLGNPTLDSINATDGVASALNTVRSRILHSHQNYIVNKIEVRKLRDILAYLSAVNVDSVLSLSETVFTQVERESKEETKKRMCGMLDSISENLADHYISQTKLKYAQQELELCQKKLQNFNNIESTILKFLSQYLLLSILFVEEKKDIDNSDQFFRKILQYITKDLQNCALRTEKMKRVIGEHQDYTSKNIGERFKLIRSFIKILSSSEDFSLSKALEVVSDFKSELNRIENTMFTSDFNNHRAVAAELENNINVLQTFLVSGPTHRIVLVPSELHSVLRQVQDHLKKQIASVKSAVEVSSTTRKVPNKWQNYRRQLWMHFYTDPKKLAFILQQIEEEFKRRKLNAA